MSSNCHNCKSDSDNWYCHNICNYTKQDSENNHIFLRNFPQNKMPIVLDERPAFKGCMENYTVQPAGPVEQAAKETIYTDKPQAQFKPTNYPLDLCPRCPDRDCFFNRILNSLVPGQGSAIEYLRRIDVDSFVRGLPQILTKCPTMKTNAFCLIEQNCCDSCRVNLLQNPDLVQIINRWKMCYPFKECYQMPSDQNSSVFKPHFYNGCPVKPIENAWNNRTRVVDQMPIKHE